MESADALMEEKKLMSEAKYRNYTTNIDKALRNFEYSSEWADLISALGKLSKAISSNTQYQVIPRRIKISKRLAQCMHPALPSGVHLKALETYAVIFSKTGPERLATELFIYSAGLFPLLGYAAMNVRPALLGIYETYFVPLGEKLRPALSGFLSGVLPGYECGLDHFERTNSLLTQVCAAVNPTHFYTVLWECMATNASIRLPAITYLLEHFNKRLTMQQQVFIMGHNRDIMMSGLCACLNDAVILVQRNTLEFLLLGFPMHTVYLSAGDLIKLVTNGLNTILRRDMSLNRRLYSWLLGSEVAKQSPTSYDAGGGGAGSEDAFGAGGEESLRESYFGQHSKHIVIEALICMLKFSLESQPVDLKPYRIMMSLLDKAEIGSAVLDFVLCDIVRTMSLSSGGNVEVVKSANVLFASFHPAYIWSFMTTLYEKTCKKKTHSDTVKVSSGAARLSPSVSESSADGRYQCHVGSGEPCLVEICYLTEFLLETISLETYNETTRIFLPKVFLAITQMLTVHLEQISSDEITASLKLCMKIVSRVQPMITSPAKLMPRRTNHGYASSDEKTMAKNATVAQVAATGTVNALEKSKSDSKLNHVGNSSSSAAFGTTAIAAKDALIDIMGRDDVGPIRRSNSNQQIERNKSPKKKKAKSYSKLSELDKEICPETGQLIDPPQSSSDLDTPHSIKKLKAKAAKTPYMRIRTSPKKTTTVSPTLNAASGPKSLDPVMLKGANATATADETDEQPKSAPPEQLVQGDRNVFDYSQDVDTNGGSIDAATTAAEFSILEKCIRQYEVFFEVYLAHKVLHVKRQPQPPTDDPVNDKCRINVPVEADRKSEPVQLQANEGVLNVENAFDNEQVYEDVSAERLREVDSLFETLLVNVVSRSKQLHSLLNRSLACSGEGVWPDVDVDVNDFSDIEYRDCVSSTEHLERQQKNTAHATNGADPNGQKARATEQRIQSLIGLRLSSSLRCSIKLAANLLVEMSTFPNCNRNIILDKTEKEIPNWLKVLCLVAAYTQSDKELQLAAITTLFDLISLLKSQIEHTTSPGVTFVVMLPLLRFGHVSFIERQTRVFHLITSVLWNYLGQSDVDPAQITALLYQQHNCLESGLVETIIGNRMYAHTMHQQFAAADALAASASNSPNYDKSGDYTDQCDDYEDPHDIGSVSAVQPELLHQQQQQQRPLASPLWRYRHDRAADIELICVSPAHPVPRPLIAQLRESEARSFKKFELLWHLGRDKQPAKGFEKTLLKVLDTLALPCYMSVRTGVTKWLQSALLRGDLSRLVKPLYKILLTPNTHRIGIMHLHLLHTTKDGQEMGAVAELPTGEDDTPEGSAVSERDIYAISSEYGNIKYHHHQLNATSGKKRSPIRTFHKKIFGVTLSSKNKTSNFVSDKAPTPTSTPPPPPSTMSASAMQEVASASEALAALDAAIGLIVNPLDGNSPDFDEEDEDLEEEVVVVVGADQRAENEASGPLAAAQYDAAAAALDDEDEYDEEDEEPDYTDGSDSSIFVDSDSENRETSVEKDESLTISSSAGGPGVVMVGGAGSLKRFVGDCERVTELLSQHERTKNRKTYRLTREKTPGDSSLASMADDQSHSSIGTIAASASSVGVAAGGEEDTAHPADEYFSEASTSATTAAANSSTITEAVNELLMEVTARVTATTSTPPVDVLQSKKNFAQMQKKRKHRRMQPAALDAAKMQQQQGKRLEKGGKKRMSCISKTSTDSNNSYVQGQSDDECEDDEGDSVAAAETVGDEQYDTQSLNTNTTTESTNTLSVATINVEEKRRNLTLETSAAMTARAGPQRKAHSATRSEWGELTQETLEKGKQNLQILRENAAAAAAAAAAATALGSGGGSKRSSTKSGNSSSGGGCTGDSHKVQVERLHFFHNHMLIYTSVYDTQQTLYAFQTLRNIIACDTRTFLCLSITTSLASGGALKQLLARHRKSIAGKGFAGNITNSEFAQSYRGCMHLEVLVTVCLFYARGFFHHDAAQNEAAPTPQDVLGNCRVQLESVELLTLICGELIDIVKGMGKGLAFYIGDLMGRCKLQKVILHCLNSAVSAFGQRFDGDTLAEQVLNFNDPRDEQLCAESFQVQLLRLLMTVIKLEHEVISLKSEAGHIATAGSSADAGLSAGGNVSPTRLVHMSTTADASSAGCGQASANVKYLPNCLISQQPMFLAAVLSALQDDRLRHLHRNWTDVVTASLNCFGSLTNIVISVVHQLCNNIDRIARLPLAEQCGFPPDYVVSQLEAITILCHYCLLDSTQQTTLSHLFNQAYPQTSVVVSQNSNNNTGQLLNSIVHTFLSSAAAAAAASQSETATPRNPQLLAARNAVLSHLSRIVASVAAVWDSELGQVRPVKQQLMEFLSPVSLHHGANFLAAVAVTWQERGEQHRKRQRQLVATGAAPQSLSVAEQYQRNSMPQACAEQLSLVTLVSSIRVMPMDSFVQTLHQVVKSPPPIHRPPAHLTVEVSALELFYFYMKSAPAPQLGDSWSSLLALLRDGLGLSPPAQFALLMLLNEFVQRCPQMPFQDKKDIRDLHDVTSRLIDSLSTVAGSCLEQTTWLRRNLAVKEDISGGSDISAGSGSASGMGGNGARESAGGGGVVGQQQQYAVQAQSVLAAILANLLDVAYGSQEKDKVVTIITTLLYNITPYLKNHTTRNVPSFYACSSLLASLSGYQYTRKAWRKDMLDLLLDNAFFQMDIACLPFWKQIMDSLMTYDNTTFRELMSRVSLTQTGSLNIFTSREQEYEQRSLMLKRLAFVIFCSEFDQYHKYMPEIQEQLANSLRLLSVVPSVQAAVFLCFRVLLLRMSPDHVTSLWPIIIAEMVQVFLAMEQELKSDSEDLSQQIRLLAGMDSSWSSSSSSGNGLNSQNHVMHWRSVQLEAAKMLELGCVLPATNLPHFQMYRWAFVGTEFDAHEEIVSVPINGRMDDDDDNVGLSDGDIAATAMLPSSLYVPHIRRIARLMDMKYAVHSPLPSANSKRGQHLVLTCQQISSLQDLHGFFSTLSVVCPNPRNFADTDKEVAACLAEIEELLARDFLERMPPSSSTTPR